MKCWINMSNIFPEIYEVPDADGHARCLPAIISLPNSPGVAKPSLRHV